MPREVPGQTAPSASLIWVYFFAATGLSVYKLRIVMDVYSCSTELQSETLVNSCGYGGREFSPRWGGDQTGVFNWKETQNFKRKDFV